MFKKYFKVEVFSYFFHSLPAIDPMLLPTILLYTKNVKN